MSKRGKKYKKVAGVVEDKEYTLQEAVKKVKTVSYSKFVGTVGLHFSINLPKDKEAKSIKGSVALPHSFGKQSKVAVFTTPDQEKAAKDAGADLVGLESLIKDVKAGKIEFDVAIATPDVMAKMAVLGKELGPKGLMPNPKNGTVTNNLAEAVTSYKKGKLNFACDETGVMHFGVGKVDMEDSQLIENIQACIAAGAEATGSTIDQVMKTTFLAPTMGPSVKFKL